MRTIVELNQIMGLTASSTVEARTLEHEHPPTPNHGKKEHHQHKTSYIHVPTFWRDPVSDHNMGPKSRFPI